MAPNSSTGTILKILSGVQSGVDVLLQDGVYTLGSGDDDDIQLFDVSLKPGHARLSIQPGKIEISGASGELRTRNGLVLAAEGALQEIEPLDVVTAGTSRFALGPRNGNWSSIVDGTGEIVPPAPPKRRWGRAATAATAARAPRRPVYLGLVPVAALLLLIGGGVWFTSMADADRKPSEEEVAETELSTLRNAVNGFDFGRRLDVEQEVDGTIFVTGFVETPVERRAIIAAAKTVAVPARIRLQVLESMRSEVANLIEEEKVKVDYEVGADGRLRLSGTVLDAAKAAKVVDLVKERVPGFAEVVSEIRTAPTLLADVEALAVRSKINPLVLLRLDGDLIEASGVLPTEKIDPWVGFLQAYSQQFADQITLRSLVQLQNPDGTLRAAPGPEQGALILGETKRSPGDTTVDVKRLTEGQYDLGDVFVGQAGRERNADGAPNVRTDAKSAAAPRQRMDLSSLLASPASEPAAGATAPAVLRRVATSATGGSSPMAGASSLAAGETVIRQPTRTTGEGRWRSAAPEQNAPTLASNRKETNGDAASRMAGQLIQLWRDGKLPDGADGQKLKAGMDALQDGDVSSDNPAIDADPITERYAPLLASTGNLGGTEACWTDSRLNGATVVGSLFWLDLLSVTRDLTLTDLQADVQPAVLEAALNPQRIEACLRRDGRTVSSIYLTEVRRNPSFVRFITRDLEAFPLDIAGADIGSGRYIQTRDGRKMREGAAPDDASRLAVVGELGIAVQKNEGYATVIFGPEVNWLVR